MNITNPKFVICTSNVGYEASLELRKLYQVVPDPSSSKLGQIRVIDESGEDYLYPPSLFVPVDLPASVADQVAHAA
jgi:hypothetical protein